MKDLTHNHNYIKDDIRFESNKNRTMIVAILTAVMMTIEIVAGFLTGSMALAADGWHMATHTIALGIAVTTYWLANSRELQGHFSFGSGKFLPLGGYTSSIVLAIIAFLMAYESAVRLLRPLEIHYNEAILVAIIGLVVNVVSVFILMERHEHSHADGHHHDHNLRAAYLHVMADGFTSLLAIVALTTAKYYQTPWADPIVGIIGSVVILKWAYGLCKDTAWELLDGHAKYLDKQLIHSLIEDAQTFISDLHLWQIAPHAFACEVVIHTSNLRGALFYKEKLRKNISNLKHIIVEENPLKGTSKNCPDARRNEIIRREAY